MSDRGLPGGGDAVEIMPGEPAPTAAQLRATAQEVGERLDKLEENLRQFRLIVLSITDALTTDISAVRTDLGSILLQLHTIEL